MQLAIESEQLTEQQLFDYGVNFVRAGIATVQGAGFPYPYGGKSRQVMVDLDLTRLYAWGLSPRDVINAVSAQNLTLPTGTIKLGEQEYPVLLNGSPETVEELNAIPVRTPRGNIVFLRDVANVRDGFAPQTSIVHSNGRRAVIMPILKSAGASTRCGSSHSSSAPRGVGDGPRIAQGVGAIRSVDFRARGRARRRSRGADRRRLDRADDADVSR